MSFGKAIKNIDDAVGNIPLLGTVTNFATAALHASDAQQAKLKQRTIDPTASDDEQANHVAWGNKAERENDQAVMSLLEAIPGFGWATAALDIEDHDVLGTMDWAMDSFDHWMGGTENPLSRQDQVAYHKMLKRSVALAEGEGRYGNDE